MDRRTFIKVAAATAGGLILGSIPLIGSWQRNNTSNDQQDNDQHQHSPHKHDQHNIDWSFLEAKVYDTEELAIPIDQISKVYVPLERGPIVDKNDQVYRELKKKYVPNLESYMAQHGLDPANYGYDFIVRRYGRPAEPRLAQACLDYCKRAVEFLYSQVNGLQPAEFDWTILQKGQDFSSKENMQGFVGAHYYNLYLARLIDLNKDNIVYHIGYLEQSVTGNMAHFEIKLEGGNFGFETYYVFIQAHLHGLAGPFSEIIPYTTLRKLPENVQLLGYERAMNADETLVEGMSHVLLKQAVKEFNIPDGEKHTANILEGMTDRNPRGHSMHHSRYSNVSLSVRWIEKNSVQKAFDLYMESPLKFLSAIGAKV